MSTISSTSTIRGPIHVRVSEKVTLESLHEVVAQIAKLSGCLQCGLIGIDLRLSGDPVELGALNKIHGVNSVGFG